MGGIVKHSARRKTVNIIKPIIENTVEFKVKDSSESIGKLNDVDTLDNFFDGLINMKNDFKKSQDEVKFYKEKCQRVGDSSGRASESNCTEGLK